MSQPTYSDATRKWALETYDNTRKQYRSRLECCTAIAKDLGAHVNTVLRWVGAEHGQVRPLTAEEVPTRVRNLEEQNAALRARNRELMEQLEGRRVVGS
ncbi:transposase [Rhodococcus hoagii]|nr:transposase [Prescottella equi]NKS61624.1 transposase [Prescottella equi]NKZ93271.1 transposase [Prescottella equi]